MPLFGQDSIYVNPDELRCLKRFVGHVPRSSTRVAKITSNKIGKKNIQKIAVDHNSIDYITYRDANSEPCSDFKVNGIPYSILYEESKGLFSNLIGYYIITMNDRVIYYSLSTTCGKYILLIGNAEGAQGKFSRVDYYFFIPFKNNNKHIYLFTSEKHKYTH